MIIKGRKRRDAGFLRLYLLPDAPGDLRQAAGNREPAVQKQRQKKRKKTARTKPRK